jgi:rhodanese-related sulfurtransferase
METAIRTISPRDLARRQDDGEAPLLIDVRSAAEYEQLRARGARWLPLDRFDGDHLPETVGASDAGRERPVYLICLSGKRSEEAARRMVRSGLPNAVVVAGGTEAWARSGLPTVRGRSVPALGLEQQVQVLLGVLLVLKVVFGFAIHPAFFLLVGGVGLAMVWAGVTRSCALTRLLERMPWNRGVAAPAQAGA